MKTKNRFLLFSSTLFFCVSMLVLMLTVSTSNSYAFLSCEDSFANVCCGAGCTVEGESKNYCFASSNPDNNTYDCCDPSLCENEGFPNP